MCGLSLWGVNVAQANAYYRSYPKDRKALKYLVGICSLKHRTIRDAGIYPLHLANHMPPSTKLSTVGLAKEEHGPILPDSKLGYFFQYIYPKGSFKYFLTTAVQCFYAMLSNKNKYLVSAIIFLSFTQMASGFALSSYMSITDTLTSVYSRFNHIAGSLELGSSMLCDILITASLVYCLRGSVASFKGTRNAINKVVMYSVNIGIVTNIVTMINLVTWLAAPPTDFTWAVFHFALGKIYVCSMLVSLNSRQDIRQIMNSGPHLTTTFNIDALPPRQKYGYDKVDDSALSIRLPHAATGTHVWKPMSLPGVELHQLNTSVGVLFEGYVVTMALYGLIAFYTYGYFEQYPKDSFGWKLTFTHSLTTLHFSSFVTQFCTWHPLILKLSSLHEYMIIEFPLVGVSVDKATKNYSADTVTSIFIVQLWVQYIDSGASSLNYDGRLLCFPSLDREQESLNGSHNCRSIDIWLCPRLRFVFIDVVVCTNGEQSSSVAVVHMILLPTFNRFSEAPFKSINLCCQGLTFLAAALTFCTLSLANHHNKSDLPSLPIVH
ncbi:hypothetical protein C8J57DRAFT_1529687 [Mycena rebaudengoi]|nr:hypothetical protein C8J57DRAFT_1529687 [Mycena rebaudengoi]